MAQNLSLSFLAELCGVALNVRDSPADEIGIVNPVADSDLPGGDPVQITGPQLDNFEFVACFKIRKPFLQVIKNWGLLPAQGGVVELLILGKDNGFTLAIDRGQPAQELVFLQYGNAGLLQQIDTIKGVGYQHPREEADASGYRIQQGPGRLV